MLQYFFYHRASHICVTRRSNIFLILIESSKFCFSLWACCGWTCCSSRSSQTPPSRCPRPRPCPPRPCVPSWILINFLHNTVQVQRDILTDLTSETQAVRRSSSSSIPASLVRMNNADISVKQESVPLSFGISSITAIVWGSYSNDLVWGNPLISRIDSFKPKETDNDVSDLFNINTAATVLGKMWRSWWSGANTNARNQKANKESLKALKAQNG